MFAPYENTLDQLELHSHFKYKVHVVNAKVKNETVYKFLSSWRTLAPFSTDKVDVLLQPDIAFGVAAEQTPTVGVFYDNIPIRYRDHHLDRSFWAVVKSEGLKAALAYGMNRRVYQKGLRRYELCNMILSISEASKKDLLETIEYPAKQVAVTPLAATGDYHSYKQSEIDKTLSSLGIQKPYVLYIGGADYRKNVDDALDAYAAAKKQVKDLHLVLVGQDFEESKLAHNKVLREKIHSMGPTVKSVGYGQDEDLPKLYAGAKAFLFPSLCEGFGFPALEAMQSNCPVVAYANSSIPEIVQGSFELANTKEQYQAILLKVLTNKDYVKKIVSAAQVASAVFGWEKTATLTLNALKQAINEDTSRR